MSGVGMCVVGMRRGYSIFLLNEITNILFRNTSNRVYKGVTHVYGELYLMYLTYQIMGYIILICS